MKIVLAIAAGGAFGAVARHYVNNQVTHWLGAEFPWGILVANVAGSFAMGVLIESLALVWSPSKEVNAFLAVGFLGAFTTFSTFGVETYRSFESGDWLIAALNVIANVAGGLLLVVAGTSLARFLTQFVRFMVQTGGGM